MSVIVVESDVGICVCMLGYFDSWIKILQFVVVNNCRFWRERKVKNKDRKGKIGMNIYIFMRESRNNELNDWLIDEWIDELMYEIVLSC